MVIIVLTLTIVSSNFIIQTSIRLNFVRLAQVVLSLAQSTVVSMETIVPLLIMKTILESTCCIITKWTWTSISFTTKQFGVLSIKLNTIGHHASMLITGKIFEESGIFTSMRLYNVTNGTLKPI